jgi:hypothetical protein
MAVLVCRVADYLVCNIFLAENVALEHKAKQEEDHKLEELEEELKGDADVVREELEHELKELVLISELLMSCW